jgi:hypothetical protein
MCSLLVAEKTIHTMTTIKINNGNAQNKNIQPLLARNIDHHDLKSLWFISL